MKNTYRLLALGMSLPFAASTFYGLIMYGNVPAKMISMGGLEIVLFWLYIAAPLALVCLIILIIKIRRLKKAGISTRQESLNFHVPFIILILLGIFFFLLQEYCYNNSGVCTFLPEQNYSGISSNPNLIQ